MSRALSETQQKLRALPEFQLPPWPAYFEAADKWDEDAAPWHKKWRKVPAGLRHSMIVRFRLGTRPEPPNLSQLTGAILKLTYVPAISNILNSSSILLRHLRRAA